MKGGLRPPYGLLTVALCDFIEKVKGLTVSFYVARRAWPCALCVAILFSPGVAKNERGIDDFFSSVVLIVKKIASSTLPARHTCAKLAATQNTPRKRKHSVRPT